VRPWEEFLVANYEQMIFSIPADAERAWNYQALFELWKEQSARTETSPEKLVA
jgi:hypothetical protein